MDPLVPGGGLAAAVARSAVMSTRDELLEKLKIGEWTYPETKMGEVNISFIFDILLIAMFLLLWVYAVASPGKLTEKINNLRGEDKRKVDDKPSDLNAIVTYCMKGNFNGNQNFGLFKYVSFFTMEEVTNWLSVSFICTIIVLKILAGSANVNAGYVIFAIFVGVIARHMRLGIKEQVKKQFPVVVFLSTLFVTLWAYTDVFGFRVDDHKSTKNSQNEMYIFAGVMFLLTAIVKTYFSVSDMAQLGPEDITAKAEALYNGEFAFYLTGASTAFIGGTIAVFVFCESIFVAYAATKYYAIPFYFLYLIPFYFLVTTLAIGCVTRLPNSKATIFNVILALLGLLVIIFAQGHVCSFPGPDGKHIVEGCGELKNMGFKELGDHDSKLKIKTWSLILLGIFSVTFHVLVYIGARFSRQGLTRTVTEVCVNAAKNGYSVL